MKIVTLALALLAACALPAAAAAATPASLQLTFKGHCFTPQTLRVPAGRSMVLQVRNASKETIEFESFKLNRERTIEPGQAISVRLPALSAGSYDFYDDFHQDVPQGTIVAK